MIIQSEKIALNAQFTIRSAFMVLQGSGCSSQCLNRGRSRRHIAPNRAKVCKRQQITQTGTKQGLIAMTRNSFQQTNVLSIGQVSIGIALPEIGKTARQQDMLDAFRSQNILHGFNNGTDFLCTDKRNFGIAHGTALYLSERLDRDPYRQCRELVPTPQVCDCIFSLWPGIILINQPHGRAFGARPIQLLMINEQSHQNLHGGALAKHRNAVVCPRADTRIQHKDSRDRHDAG